MDKGVSIRSVAVAFGKRKKRGWLRFPKKMHSVCLILIFFGPKLSICNAAYMTEMDGFPLLFFPLFPKGRGSPRKV